MIKYMRWSDWRHWHNTLPCWRYDFGYMNKDCVKWGILAILIWRPCTPTSTQFDTQGQGRTGQVGRLVRRPGGPPRQMLQQGVERRRGSRERGLYFGKLFAASPEFLVIGRWWRGRSAISQGRFEEPAPPPLHKHTASLRRHNTAVTGIPPTWRRLILQTECRHRHPMYGVL